MSCRICDRAKCDDERCKKLELELRLDAYSFSAPDVLTEFFASMTKWKIRRLRAELSGATFSEPRPKSPGELLMQKVLWVAPIASEPFREEAMELMRTIDRILELES